MKLKVTIAGPRVHDVGYRVFLGKLAMSLALPGFTAYNWKEERHQEVVALIKGDPARICNTVQTDAGRCQGHKGAPGDVLNAGGCHERCEMDSSWRPTLIPSTNGGSRNDRLKV